MHRAGRLCAHKNAGRFLRKVDVQMKLKIAYQGVAGAYSHIASMTVYPGQEYVPCDTFEIAMNLVQNGQVDLAMIPVENSNAGRVSDVHFLLSLIHI